MLRQFKMAPVYTDHATYPNIADITADFVYARLQRGEDNDPDRLSAESRSREWAGRLQTWAEGKEPKDLDRVDGKHKTKAAAARRVRLRDPRGQDPRTGRGDGADREAEGVARGQAKKTTTKANESERRAKSGPALHHRLRTIQARCGDGRAQARQGQAPGRHPRGRGLAQARLFQAPACRDPRRERHRLSASAKARHARRRAARPRAPASSSCSGKSTPST